jgi:siroheme synthase-like protein
MRKDSQGKKILPVSLLLEGKPCLVVGGGPIAARKVGHLLAAGAAVTVVSPAVCEDIAQWKKDRVLRHKPRVFSSTDVKGQSVVFAVTDNGPVNLAVIKACRRARVLCSAADAHWSEGDFVSPAVIRKHGLVVAVSTGGECCARSRAIKEKLAHYLASLKL